MEPTMAVIYVILKLQIILLALKMTPTAHHMYVYAQALQEHSQQHRGIVVSDQDEPYTDLIVSFIKKQLIHPLHMQFIYLLSFRPNSDAD
jgi:hypothetical protein